MTEEDKVLIEDLKKVRLNLKQYERATASKIRGIEMTLGSLITGINVGDTISYAHGRSPLRRRAKVVGFEPWTDMDRWILHVMSIRRDGSEGAQMNVYPYQDYRKEVSE